VPEGVNLHRESFEALYQQSVISCGKAHAYELYMDGATAGDNSAWAVVAVAVSDSGRRFLGCLGGLTEIDSGSPKRIGAAHQTNIDAELSAMVFATAFAFFGSEDAQFVIRPDLALSHRFLWIQSTTRQDSVLAKVLHVLGESLPSNIAVEEVRAHCGDPWNELADSVAKHIAKTGVTVGAVPWRVVHQIATSPLTIKWEWLRREKDSYQKTMPALHSDAVWQTHSFCKEDWSVHSKDAT